MFQLLRTSLRYLTIRSRNFFQFHVATVHIYALQKIFHFDKWHIYGSSRPDYVKVVARILNNLDLNGTVVEVGCGLGNILRLSKFQRKVGLDIEANVIRAAKLVNLGKSIQFQIGSFREARNFKNIDVLVAINWVHNIDSESLIGEFLRFPRMLILTEGVENYKYFHSRDIFISEFIVISEVTVDSRHIFLLIKK